MKNTIILYLRMIVTLIVSFYTSRVTLELLGIDDFGVYGVIGSVVTMFAFMSRTLTVSFNRYLCKGVSHNDNTEISLTIGAAIKIQLMIIAAVVLLSETVGIWFINNYLVISPEKYVAAHIVFQFSILTFIIGIFSSAYNSIIIAYEKMTVYAYLCIFEICAKLGVTFLLSIFASNRLIYYAIFICAVQFFILLLYAGYVRKRFPSIKPLFSGSGRLVREMLSFVGYGFIGSFAFVAKNQGINFLLNIFGGPVLNAARSISFQVYSAVYNFVGNFQTAFSPYILKKQEINQEVTCNEDVNLFTHLSFGIMMVLAIPIIFATNVILNIWLGDNVPIYTSQFIKLILLIGICEAISSPLHNIIYGSGKIRFLQISVFLVQAIVIFSSLFMLRQGFSPVSVYVIDFTSNILLVGIRLITAARNTELHLLQYLKNSALPIIVTSVLIFVIYRLFCDHEVISIISAELIMVIYLYFAIPKHIIILLKNKVLRR